MTQSNRSTTQHYQQLSAEERGEIQILLEDNYSVRQIAQRLRRSPSTISREIKRGTVQQRSSDYLFFHRYFADSGQRVYQEHRSHCHAYGLLLVCHRFFEVLCQALKKHFRVDSIDGIVHWFHRRYPELPCPSTPTVYRYIDQGRLPLDNTDLPMKLRRRTKNSRKTHQRTNKKVLGTSIEERPASVDQRSTQGDWEGDLVKGKREASEPALMTLTERYSRFEIIVKIANYHAKTCRQALQDIIETHGQKAFRSITFDNGSEFSELDQITGTQIYFAHPYSPWERGSNENQNGLIREYLPKGKSMTAVTSATVQSIQDAMNNKHRKALKYHSAAEIFSPSGEGLL